MPHVAGVLYGHPWMIKPEDHAELGRLYQSYIRGTLPELQTVPEQIEGKGRVGFSGISYDSDITSGICVVNVIGIIAKRAPSMLCGPLMADLACLDELIYELKQDDRIHTVVMNFDTPGGSVIGLPETAANLRELADEKRLVAYTDMQSCSAGYYLMTECPEIYAAPSSVIGSIGTYMAALDDSRAWEMEGLELKLFKVGEYKALGHPGKKWTPEEEKLLQDITDKCGAEFRDQVTGRRPEVELSTMQGQWFFAKDAPKGLIDGLYRDLPELLADLMSENAA
jgi:signal peptide peptidase SppA